MIQAAGLTFRRARAVDVATIVALLADDMLGAAREASADAEAQLAYLAAFGEIDADPNQLLAVAELNGEIVGTLQLTFIPGLSRHGSKRGIIEAVRVASDSRSKKIGEAMIAWAIEQCRERRCRLVQLTTDKARIDAHRFYDRLGFEASHIGYKLAL
ncbi:GNAT family N-acetyltransferase [Novosphingobium aquiterrae]|uniref:GNAT family N-acetyltransferase n=1 Tax=Novosphingobium aquiterrae TaxID=624388 RepID=A0ABV6PFQ7_9SPHN